jgi:hypothetical protein
MSRALKNAFKAFAAAVLGAFRRCGAPCLDDFYSTVRGKALRGGYITVLHTQGRNGQYHPHLSLLATSGGYDTQGARWEHLEYLPDDFLGRKWQWHLLRIRKSVFITTYTRGLKRSVLFLTTDTRERTRK